MFPQRMTSWIPLIVLFCPANILAGQALVEINQDFNLSTVETRDVKLTRNNAALRLETGRNIEWPGITLKAPGGRWNLAAFQCLTLDVKNVSSAAVTVNCRVDNPGADGSKNCVTQSVDVTPGGQETLRVPLPRRLPEGLRGKLFGMRGFPGGMSAEDGLDPANISQLLIFVGKPTENYSFEVSNIRADGLSTDNPPAQLEKFFPMIDAFGQYIHKDWPGKIHSADELAARKTEEAADLDARPSPENWDQYGGWKAGPQLPATGFFRTEKHNGRWWLVDPEGRLFWSHGIDCVRSGNATTPITDRKHWFADLPKPDSPFAPFYGQGNWGPHNYYEGKQYDTYDFSGANLMRKYGKDWQKSFNDLTHRRLRSWGLNTIGNWSDSTIYLMRKTPYVATVGIQSKTLGGSSGYWGKFADVFDSEFQTTARLAIARHKDNAAGDPWCIGFFIDNELSWGDEFSLAIGALQSPADQPAKKVFAADLKQKYETIERLNSAWGAKYASWDALMQSTAAPDAKKARDDLAAFATKTADRYFEVCRDSLKEIAPHQLYLGCRFAWTNDRAVRAAAKYCDVVSFNRYQRTLAGKHLPSGVDKPTIVGEFHFGALDRGMFHTGLVYTGSQAERAAAYKTYVRSALENPCIVGTHWFQFGDQATTGRGDGENYQIGFLDVCDTPYAETIRACREVARDMYPLRAK